MIARFLGTIQRSLGIGILKRLGLGVFTATLLFIFFCGTANAFHSGGVGECVGCHDIHAPATGAPYLLKGTDQSSTCLLCHENSGDIGPNSYHISTAERDMPTRIPPKQRTPGGDFSWLKKSYIFTVNNLRTIEPGERHGHNIVAIDKNYFSDSVNNTSPGGSFTSSNLSCISCHDPHGRYRRLGNGTISTTGDPIMESGSYNNSPDSVTGQSAVGVYRLLGGIGFRNSKTSSVSFTVNPPTAVAPSTYNRSEDSTQTRVAYGSGMTAWCATCHDNMHTSVGMEHPLNETIGSERANRYNSYVKTGDMTGKQTSSYLSLVPYEENTTNYSTLKAIAAKSGTSPLSGPNSNSIVMCLTCHRAHASGWNHIFRWNNDVTYIIYNGFWPGIDSTPTKPELARGRLRAETKAAYYDRTETVFAKNQEVLCNKCHTVH